jgi:radical SAM/Cys-rich protein
MVGVHAGSFADAVAEATGAPLQAAAITTFQVNVGLRCNLACHHCHVESGPKRPEAMSWATMEQVLAAARSSGARTVDITGGAPEMNPDFRRFVTAARAQGHEVIVRTNLTIALQPGFTDLPEFFRAQQVHLIASLPCYTEENVDAQRGRHAYQGSVQVLRRLNALGYGIEPHLQLDLVYNPGGPKLPGPQAQLEADYRRELAARSGIRFHRLYTITNMAIGRFERDLIGRGESAGYRALLREHFNAATLDALMCRHQVHVGHDGTLHDCDFNYALGMGTAGRAPRHIRDFDAEALRNRRIATAEHCFGCTAGCGSSCGGALLAAS